MEVVRDSYPIIEQERKKPLQVQAISGRLNSTLRFRYYFTDTPSFQVDDKILQYQQVASPAGVIGRELLQTRSAGLKEGSGGVQTTSHFVHSGEMALSCLLSVGEPRVLIYHSYVMACCVLHRESTPQSTLSTTHYPEYPLLSLPILFYPH